MRAVTSAYRCARAVALAGVAALVVAAPRAGARPGAAVPSASAGTSADAVTRLARTGLPVYCGSARGRYVALTFDDGPTPRTPLLLRLLARAHVHATFFLVGRQVEAYPSYASREAAYGTVGDHTWSHAWLTELRPAAVAGEITRARSLVERLTGDPVALFRPPGGFHNRAVDREVRRLGLLQVIWSVDSEDAAPHGGLSARGIAARVRRFLRPGAIVLMHENRPETLQALRRTILPEVRRRKLRPVTVPELLALAPPSREQLRKGLYGCPDGSRAA